MPDTVVQLSRSYQNPFNGTSFNTVTLREPRYGDVFADGMGPPYELQPNGSGGAMVVTHYEVIRSYVERLVTAPDLGALTELSASDAMKLSKAVTDFFSEPAASSSTPTGSSSEAASPQT